MTAHETDYYILPSTWCEACERQVTCGVLVWEVAQERIATFQCPGCGQTLGVGVRGLISWSARHVSGRPRRADVSNNEQ